MQDQIQVIVEKQTESTAYVIMKAHIDSPIRSISGKLIGPHCQFARTLPAEFDILATKSGVSVSHVVDPCYWTPALPFLYELKLALKMQDGQEIELMTQVGLRRWGRDGSNFRLESRRHVLRGTSCNQFTQGNVEKSHISETVLIIDRFDQEFIKIADRLGVVLVLDLRKAGDSLSEILDQLNWSPSVFLALFNAGQLIQLQTNTQVPRHCHLAQCLTASSNPEDLINLNPNEYLHLNSPAVAVELSHGERPPAWLASTNKPVIVIRRGEGYADFTAARAACDRLQAELAPEFDLAGYFVTP